MVGFGFMDNIIMIQAGDLIDSTLGVTLGITTLTAAALAPPAPLPPLASFAPLAPLAPGSSVFVSAFALPALRGEGRACARRRRW